MNKFGLLTVTHRDTKLSELGDFFLDQGDHPELRSKNLRALQSAFGLQEVFHMQTCNRVLYFFTSTRPLDVLDFWRHSNPQLQQREDEQLLRHSRYLEGDAALQHLISVASSLDSLVVGEREILGQIKSNFEYCQAEDFIGDHLRLTFKYLIPTAKKVFSQTRIAEKPISVVSLASRKLNQLLDGREARILMVGAGQTMRLMSKFVHRQHQGVQIFNRSLKAAQDLAPMLRGQAHSLDALHQWDNDFDVIISCTGSDEPIINRELYHKLESNTSGDHPKILIDLAVPGDFEASIPQHHNCHYIDVEALREDARENLAFREKELDAAHRIVSDGIEDLRQAIRSRRLEKLLGTVPGELKALREKATEEVFRNELEGMDEQSRETLEKILDYMERKYVSIPMKAIRKAAVD
jgi:glutamyl-tRNA reductase